VIPNLLSTASYCDDVLTDVTREQVLAEMEDEFAKAIEHQYELFSHATNSARRDIWLGNLCEQLAMTVVGLENVGRFLTDFVNC
jgi:hypothetical protein